MATTTASHVSSALADTAFGRAAGRRELEQLEQMTTMLQIREGEQIITGHTFGREAFIVVTGRFAVALADSDVDVVVGPGSIIGELALITNARRNATVTALEEATVLVLTPAEFSSMIASCPNIARRVLTDAVVRSQR